jgi:hypothetical protein
MGWLTGWAKRFKIIVDASKIDADLTGFPLAVYLNSGAGLTDFDVTAIFDDLNPEVNTTFTGLQHWYRMLKSSTNLTDSQATKHLACSSSGFGSIDGLWGKIADVDGSSYAEAASPTALTKTFAFSWWFKTSSASARQDMFSYGDVAVAEKGILCGLDSGIPTMEKAGAARVTASCRAVNDNLWHHAALVADNGATAFYIDGAKVTSASWTSMNLDGSGYICLGCIHYTAQPYKFTGQMADFRIYNRSLSAIEVRNIMRGAYRKIALTLSDGETQCAVEVAAWHPAKKKGLIFTKASVADAANTELYLYFDPTQSDNANVGEPGSAAAQAVWDSNFVAVHHMFGNILDTGGMLDSTANGHNGTGVNVELADHYASDGMDGSIAINLDGSNEGITLGTHADYDLLTAVTIEAMFKSNSMPGVASGKLIEKDYNGASAPYLSYSIGQYSTTSKYNFECNSGGAIREVRCDTDFTSGYHCAAGVYNKTDMRFYRDGVLNCTPNAQTGDLVENNTKSLRVGCSRQGTSECFGGKIFEARVSKVARSAAWLKASALSLLDQLVTLTSSLEFNMSAPLSLTMTLHDAVTGTAVAVEADFLEMAMTLNNVSVLLLPYSKISLRATASKPRALIT